MEKEYGNSAAEYTKVKEVHPVHENFGTETKEYIGNDREYVSNEDEYAVNWQQKDTKQKQQREKARKRHAKLIKKMAYTVVSTVTVLSMAQTLEPVEDSNKVPPSEIVGTEDTDKIPPSEQTPSTEDDVVVDISKAQTVVFSGSGTLTKEIVEAEVAKYEFPDGCIAVIEGYSEIGENAFRDCDDLVKVEIPDSVKKIGNGGIGPKCSESSGS